MNLKNSAHETLLDISSVGDISFYGSHSDTPNIKLFSDVSYIFDKSDIVIANLENPLISSNIGNSVKGKCTLRGCTGWADVLMRAGINVVSLANNHMMDYGVEGLQSTFGALEKSGIYYVGAGNNLTEANSPLFLNIKGSNVAILARTQVSVASPSYAGDYIPGVAFLNINDTLKTISDCKTKADYVILLLHWGVEEYDYPTPDQRKLAKKLINAGVDLILGHHPHVIQGIEQMNNSTVCYSLGNFVFNEFNWSYASMDGKQHETSVLLNKKNKLGVVINAKINKKETTIEEFFTRINSSGLLKKDNELNRRRNFDRLCLRLKWPAYDWGWKLYSLKREWMLRIYPLIEGKLTWKKIKKIRFKNFKQLLITVVRSLRITMEKSTNPYD